MPVVAPSFLASDFLHLAEACDMVNRSEAEWFHLDVMDGRFVPNISFGMPIIQQIRKTTRKICDVHLMIVEPEKYAEAFKEAGADVLTVHYEICPHLHRNIQQIKNLGMKAGVALNPHTPVELLKDCIQDIDMVLIMSVNPGFGGQQFIPHTYTKIRELKKMIQERNLSTQIEVDGGVTLENAGQLVKAGADILVAGSTVFHAKDPLSVISALKNVQPD